MNDLLMDIGRLAVMAPWLFTFMLAGTLVIIAALVAGCHDISTGFRHRTRR